VAVALTARFDLLADLKAASRARRLVSEVLAAWNRAEDAEVARLLVTEIVTNAVRVQLSESTRIPESSRPVDGERIPEGARPVQGDERANRPRVFGASTVTDRTANRGRWTSVRLALVAHPDRVRFLVGDDSPLPPVLRAGRAWDESGRGIQLVASLASDWGVLDPPPEAGHGKQVWFELAAEGTPPDGTASEVTGRAVAQEV